tara:strand:- start:159 stop:773 length:615 start_codon:yes stop_codon:yes gene_type:complete
MRSNVVISKSYTKPILDWLLDGDNLEKYLSLSPYHASGKVIARPNIDLRDQELVDGNFPFKDFFHLRDLILQQYDLPLDLPIDDNYGFMIVVSYKGHSTQLHKDPNRNREGPDASKHDTTNMPYFVTDKLHCRFNILIQSPEGGGNPIIDGVEFNIEENEPWMVQAGLYYHGSSVVEGDKIRILCSFGHYIPIELADERGWSSM